MRGFSERDCIRIGEDAYEDNRFDNQSYESAMSDQYEEWCRNHPDNPDNAKAVRDSPDQRFVETKERR
jgi:hypothetical protein